MVNDIFEEKEQLNGTTLICCLQQIFGPAISEIDFLVSQLRRVAISNGTLLLREGQVCDSIYFVEDGLLRTFLNIDGKQVNTEFFFTGEFAAAFTSFSLQKITC